MNTPLTTNETLVHHATVDLYELHDADAVTAVDVSEYTGLTWGVVHATLVSLQSKNVLEMDYAEDRVVTSCDNLGYFPLSELSKKVTVTYDVFADPNGVFVEAVSFTDENEDDCPAQFQAYLATKQNCYGFMQEEQCQA